MSKPALYGFNVFSFLFFAEPTGKTTKCLEANSKVHARIKIMISRSSVSFYEKKSRRRMKKRNKNRIPKNGVTQKEELSTSS